MGSNILKITLGLLLAVLLYSCSAMPKGDRVARNQDLFNRFSRHTLVAVDASALWEDYLILRKNDTFVYRCKLMGVTNLSYYTGTYSLSSGVLKLHFDPLHAPPIDDEYTLALKGKELHLQGAVTAFDVVENPHPLYNIVP